MDATGLPKLFTQWFKVFPLSSRSVVRAHVRAHVRGHVRAQSQVLVAHNLDTTLFGFRFGFSNGLPTPFA